MTIEAVSAVPAAAQALVPALPLGGLQLDRRQRAMLAEMGVRVWLPAPARAATRADTHTGSRASNDSGPHSGTDSSPYAADMAVLAASTRPYPAEPTLSSVNAAVPVRPPASRAQGVAAGGAAFTPSHMPQPAASLPATAAAASHNGERGGAVAHGRSDAIQTPPPPAPGQPLWQALHAGSGADIVQAAGQCQQCALSSSRQHSIWQADAATWLDTAPAAKARPRWLVLLDPPGLDEDRGRQAAQGDAGRLLRNMMTAVGVSPGQVYCTHVTKCALPAGRSVRLEELQQCSLFLHAEIARIQPDVVLALGRSAAYGLLQRTEPLGQLRGQIHHLPLPQGAAAEQGAAGTAPDAPSRAVPLVVSYPLGYLLRDASAKARAWLDLGLALLACQQAEQAGGLQELSAHPQTQPQP